MKRSLLILAGLSALLCAQAEIEILYLAPSDSSPVLGSISTDSEAYESATPVPDKGDWMEVVRKDFYSGFIAKDSLTSDGTVEIGTAMLLTPSKTGKVLTTIEPGDEVSVNLVDDWTEITVHKAIPGYFLPASSKETPPAGAGLSNRRVTYASDPLLARAGQTRYTPSPVADGLATTSSPVAATPTIPTAEPMTGFEEVDSLNPTFGRTSPSGQTEGYTLGAGSTPIPREDTTAPFLDTSMEEPTSVAAIPAPTATDPDPTIEPPTQSEEVDALSDSSATDIEGEDGAATELVEPDDAVMADEETAATVEEAGEASDAQESALESIDEGTEDMAAEDETMGDSDVIPLAPAAATTATPTPSSGEEPQEAEPVESAPTVIVEVEEDVEVANDVAEAVVPGITQPIAEDEPPLIPPTDTNRIYIGQLQRTSKSFWGSKPEHDFELLNYSGDLIAYVDLSEVPVSSYERYTKQIVKVLGVIVPSEDEDVRVIKAANITLR